MHDREDEEVTAFVRARYGSLLRTAFLLCGDRGKAEDLVQTTLAKTVVVWPRLQHSEGVDHYVRRILVNTFVTWRRRRSWWEQPLGRLMESQTRDEYVGVEQRDLLRRALDGLPARQRAAVVLRFYEDLSEKDTAHVLGCSVGTVKSLSSRGLQTLRKRWVEADAVADQEVRYA
ncbi:SigE family RNA polymerase sigma factor [Micromonospora sp. NPDC002575]|uniref:SigE family RNA polymerase sigma factor n=1 Tax=Micromonospora sp. NPDC002575 TaxID=3364222 RepID=UPI0036745EAF